jgi:hypothetical protein
VNNILNPPEHKYAIFGSAYDNMTDEEKTAYTNNEFLPFKEVHLNEDSTFRVVTNEDVAKKKEALEDKFNFMNAVINTY